MKPSMKGGFQDIFSQMTPENAFSGGRVEKVRMKPYMHRLTDQDRVLSRPDLVPLLFGNAIFCWPMQKTRMQRLNNNIQHKVEHLSKVEFQDQITANSGAHGGRGIPHVHTHFPVKLAPSRVAGGGGGGRKGIACNRRADECQCASIVRIYCGALLPVWRISLPVALRCTVLHCVALQRVARRVTDIPDNNTSHITEECHTASLGVRQQPAGERGCHW